MSTISTLSSQVEDYRQMVEGYEKEKSEMLATRKRTIEKLEELEEYCSTLEKKISLLVISIQALDEIDTREIVQGMNNLIDSYHKLIKELSDLRKAITYK